VKEPDRRRSRAQGLGRGPAVAQVAEEGRDQGRMRPERLEAQALAVGAELPPPRLIAG
jgi:hypothetical protein